jgi:hypothetical protein
MYNKENGYFLFFYLGGIAVFLRFFYCEIPQLAFPQLEINWEKFTYAFVWEKYHVREMEIT